MQSCKKSRAVPLHARPARAQAAHARVPRAGGRRSSRGTASCSTARRSRPLITRPSTACTCPRPLRRFWPIVNGVIPELERALLGCASRSSHGPPPRSARASFDRRRCPTSSGPSTVCASPRGTSQAARACMHPSGLPRRRPLCPLSRQGTAPTSGQRERRHACRIPTGAACSAPSRRSGSGRTSACSAAAPHIAACSPTGTRPPGIRGPRGSALGNMQRQQRTGVASLADTA